MNNMMDNKIWAVVGATVNKNKYGYKILKKLKNDGYEVYPVNPNYNEIEGEKCYANLSELPKTPQVIDMVVSPKIGVNVIKEASDLGIKNIWFQPGTVDEGIIKLVTEKGINYVQGCVLVDF